MITEGEKKGHMSGSERNTTNNRMEITAVIKGLEQLSGTSQKVTIYTDSMYVIGAMTQRWERNANRDLLDALDKLCENRSIKWEHVRAHSGHPENDFVDRCAREAARVCILPF